ncbi:MAG: TolC family protein, partial [Myxococcota bacterium]
LGFLAPSPPARGNATQSSTPWPAAYGWFDQYGVMTRVEFSLIWPVYTFGKLSLLQKAAAEGVQVGRMNVRLARSKLNVLVRKAYYGLLFAKSSLFLLDDADDYIEQARKRVKGKTDRLKIEVFAAQLGAQRVKAETGEALAQSGLSRLTGLPVRPLLRLKAEELEEPLGKVQNLGFYQKLASRFRPELRVLEHAKRAKRSLLEAQKRAWTPDLFLAGLFRAAYTSSATDQLSPFARDDFNFIEGGLLLGLRWKLDIPLQVIRAQKAQAQFDAFRFQAQLAEKGIAMQVEQHYRQMVAAARATRIMRKGRKAANQWMTKSMIAYSSGLIETRELTDALTALAQSRFAYLQSVYQWCLSTAELSRAVGTDITKVVKKKARHSSNSTGSKTARRKGIK